MSKRRDPLCTVDGCNRPVRDSLVCQACADALAEALGDVPALTGELETTIGRQSRLGAGGRSSNRPLMFAWDPSVMRDSLRNTLTTWTRILHDTYGGELPADTIPAVARWLLVRVDWLRAHPAAAEAVDEITACVDDCRRAVDRPADRRYAGPCTYTEGGETCGADLYARLGAPETRCRVCGTTYDVADRKAWLMAAAWDTLAPAPLIAGALSRWLDREITPSMIRGYAHRKRLTKRGEDQAGSPMYKLGEVVEILLGTTTKRAS